MVYISRLWKDFPRISSLRNLLFHLVQRTSLHFKSPDLYLFCTTKVFRKFLLPFQSQASFQSEQFGSYDYAPRTLSLVACSLSSQRSRMLRQKRPLFAKCFHSLHSRHLKVVGARKNRHARGTRDGKGSSPLAFLPLARPFFLAPTTSKRLLRRLVFLVCCSPYYCGIFKC